MRNAIAIEGLIGAGKTTFINDFMKSSCFNRWCRFFLEPVENFQKAGGRELLRETYESPKENAFFLQVHIMNVLYDHYRFISFFRDEPMIMERSHLSPLAFIKTYYELDYLDEAQYHVLRRLYDFLFADIELPGLILYFHQPVEQCLQHIAMRARAGESTIDANFLKVLQKNYLEILRARAGGHLLEVRSLEEMTNAIKNNNPVLNDCLFSFGRKCLSLYRNLLTRQ